jgi:hypothetical protein
MTVTFSWKFHACATYLIQPFCSQHQNRLNLNPFPKILTRNSLPLRVTATLPPHHPVAGSFSCTRAYPAAHGYYRGCWAAECASQNRPVKTLEYCHIQSNSEDLYRVWLARNLHSHLPDNRVRVGSVSWGYARPVLPIQYRTPSISVKKCQGVYIYMYLLVICFVYTCIGWSCDDRCHIPV